MDVRKGRWLISITMVVSLNAGILVATGHLAIGCVDNKVLMSGDDSKGVTKIA